MTETKLALTEKRKIIGTRLNEVIIERNYTKAKLIHQTHLIFGAGYKMPSSLMTMIIKGRRSLSQDYAFKFADILKIDPGYLTGIDNYRAKNYSEYLELMDDRKVYKEAHSAYTKYDSILDPFGFKVVSLVIDSANSSYGLSHRGKIAIVSGEKMDRFQEEIKQYIKKKLDMLMLENHVPELDNVDFSTIELTEMVKANPGIIREVKSDEKDQ